MGALKKEIQRNLFAPSTMQEHREKLFSPDTKSVDILALDFPTSRTLRCLLFTSHPIYVFFVIQPIHTKTLHLSL
jgi:hypothetical protein